MTSLNLLEFARGPSLWFAVAVFVVGSAWRIIAILRLGTKPDFSEPRSDRLFAGAMHGIFSRMIPHKEFRNWGKLGIYNGYMYHIGLAIIVFGFLPHILFVERLTGLSWPSLPGPLIYLAVGPTIVGLLVVLLERLTDPVLRLLSGADDYFSWLVVFLPIVTGMGALSGWTSEPASIASPPYPLPIAFHLLSVELLLVWLPFGKLAHVFLVFLSRGVTGAALARKGAAL
jgi:nitrate reductase gamma subunit